MNDTTTQHDQQQKDHSPSLSLYAWVLAGLLVLLLLTAGAHYLFAGKVSLIIAMLIAIAKAAMVVCVFMHLKYESAVVRIFAAAGVFWLALMVLFTVADVLTRR